MMAAAAKKEKTPAEVPPLIGADLDASPGHKVTTIRLTQMEYDQVQLFCSAMDNMSLTEFAGRAIREYMKHCAADPELRKEVKRQINKQRRALDAFATQVLGSLEQDA